jgi:threonine dehydrogenase-like Zn-dependent dehydrogenase
MRALIFDGHVAEVRDVPEPAGGDGTAIVRMVRVGVCNTDLEIVRGYMGFSGILGHELLGVVEAGPPEWLGKRVVAEINFACDACESCERGLGRHCTHRTVMGILGADGAMAELVAVPVKNLRAVPAGLDDDGAVFAEPLAAAFEILEQVHVTPDLSVTVLGDGKLGLLVAQVIHLTGARLLAVGKHRDKLDRLRRRGIETTLAADWSGEPADIVVEATGTKGGFAAAIAATKPRGKLILKSTVADAVELHLAPIVIHEIQVIGSRCGSFSPALQALSTGSIDVASLVTDRFPLSRAREALHRAAEPGVMKVLLEPG